MLVDYLQIHIRTRLDTEHGGVGSEAVSRNSFASGFTQRRIECLGQSLIYGHWRVRDSLLAVWEKDVPPVSTRLVIGKQVSIFGKRIAARIHVTYSARCRRP